MYAEYFGLKDNPFSIAPDPRFVYMSPHHQEALGHLLYGTNEDGGFVQLTGEVGTGKTTLIRTLLEQQLADVDVALTLNPRLTVHEFLASVCDELHIDYPRDSETLKPLIDALNAHLLRTHAQGRRTVLIIDEAQNLSRDVLEQIRLLTNLETNRAKLLRIMLVGQPELRDMLARDDLRQLAQRITARYHLGTLTRKQTEAYVEHRLKVAGGYPGIFRRGAMMELHRLSRGIPRLINVICDRALMGAYSQNQHHVDRHILRRAAAEVLEGTTLRDPAGGYRNWFWGTAVMVSIAAGAALYIWRPFLPDLAPQVQSEAVAKAAAAEPVVETPAAESNETGAEAGNKTEPVPVLQLFNATSNQPVSILLAQWGQAIDPEDTASGCAQAESLGLLCLAGRSDWAELRLFDLPGVLTLNDDEGGFGKVVLTAIELNEAVIETPQGQQRYSLAELGERWTGEYMLLWQPPFPRTHIGPESPQSHIRWLQQRLDMFEGKKTPVTLPYTYDAGLRNRVRNFQGTNGLAPDGLVGERTLIRLNQLAPAPGTPALGRGIATQAEGV